MDKIILTEHQVLIGTKDVEESIIDTFLDGELTDNEALAFNVRLARIKEGIDKALKHPDVKSFLIDSAEKYGANKSPIKIDGAEVSVCPTYTRYDYSECGHPVMDFYIWLTTLFKSEIKRIEDELKLIPTNRFAEGKPVPPTKDIIIDIPAVIEMLKTMIDNGQDMIDMLNEKGDRITVTAPQKTQTIGIKISKK